MLVPIIMTGFALSFVFVPIGSMATATLRNEEIGNSSGIFNLLRNIGGSIGISLASTVLVRRMSYHQTRIAASVPQAGRVFQQYTQGMGSWYGRQLGHPAGQPAALAALYMQLQRQALVWSFVDIFRWTALVAFTAAGLAWLFRRISARADGSVQVH
jgi:DHA2 family multidrug resistance protein